MKLELVHTRVENFDTRECIAILDINLEIINF